MVKAIRRLAALGLTGLVLPRKMVEERKLPTEAAVKK